MKQQQRQSNQSYTIQKPVINHPNLNYRAYLQTQSQFYCIEEDSVVNLTQQMAFFQQKITENQNKYIQKQDQTSKKQLKSVQTQSKQYFPQHRSQNFDQNEKTSNFSNFHHNQKPVSIPLQNACIQTCQILFQLNSQQYPLNEQTQTQNIAEKVIQERMLQSQEAQTQIFPPYKKSSISVSIIHKRQNQQKKVTIKWQPKQILKKVLSKPQYEVPNLRIKSPIFLKPLKSKPQPLRRQFSIIDFKEGINKIYQLDELSEVEILKANNYLIKKINQVKIKYEELVKNRNYHGPSSLNSELSKLKNEINDQQLKISNLFSLKKRMSLEYQQKLTKQINQSKSKIQSVIKNIKQLSSFIKKYENINYKQFKNQRLNQIALLKSEIVIISIELQKNQRYINQINTKSQLFNKRINQLNHQTDYSQTLHVNRQIFDKYVQLKVKYTMQLQQIQKIKLKLKNQINNKHKQNMILKQKGNQLQIKSNKIDSSYETIFNTINMVNSGNSNTLIDKTLIQNQQLVQDILNEIKLVKSQFNQLNQIDLQINTQSQINDIINQNNSPKKNLKLSLFENSNKTSNSLYIRSNSKQNQNESITTAISPANINTARQYRMYRNDKLLKIKKNRQKNLSFKTGSVDKQYIHMTNKKQLSKEKSKLARFRNIYLNNQNMRIKTDIQKDDASSLKLPNLVLKKNPNKEQQKQNIKNIYRDAEENLHTFLLINQKLNKKYKTQQNQNIQYLQNY